MQECARTCKKVQECASKCLRILKYAVKCKNMQERATISNNMQEYTRKCKNVQGFSSIYIWVFLNMLCYAELSIKVEHLRLRDCLHYITIYKLGLSVPASEH